MLVVGLKTDDVTEQVKEALSGDTARQTALKEGEKAFSNMLLRPALLLSRRPGWPGHRSTKQDDPALNNVVASIQAACAAFSSVSAWRFCLMVSSSSSICRVVVAVVAAAAVVVAVVVVNLICMAWSLAGQLRLLLPALLERKRYFISTPNHYRSTFRVGSPAALTLQVRQCVLVWSGLNLTQANRCHVCV